MKIILAILFSVIVGFDSHAQKTTIYVLPANVEQAICRYLDKQNGTYFCIFEQNNLSQFVLTFVNNEHLNSDIQKNWIKYISSSSHRLLVNQKIIVMIFYTDFVFGTTMDSTSIPKLSERLNEERGINRVLVNFESSYRIVFNYAGEIFKESNK